MAFSASTNIFSLTILLVAVVVPHVYSLQCWSCSSDLDYNCMDYFNTTRIFRDRQQPSFYSNQQFPARPFNGPVLMECTTSRYNMRPLCMKRVMTVSGGRVITSRECKSVQSDQYAGRCPSEPHRYDISVDFCEFCDYDGCNGAGSVALSAILTLLAPLMLFLICRH